MYANDPNCRISDAEREAAMATLGRAFAEGRLTIDEYDERVQEVAAARTGSELAPLFSDLPRQSRAGMEAPGVPGTMSPGAGAVSGIPGQTPEKLYTAQEIDAAYQQGKRTKLGLLGLTTVGAVGGAIALDLLVAAPAASLLLLLIPTVWILLYILKAGPRQWHMPSPAAVNRQRLRELKTAEKMAAAELRMAEQDRLAQLRLQRREQTEQLANRALGFMNRSLDAKWIDDKLRGVLGGNGGGAGGGKDAGNGDGGPKRDPDNPYGRSR